MDDESCAACGRRFDREYLTCPRCQERFHPDCVTEGCPLCGCTEYMLRTSGHWPMAQRLAPHHMAATGFRWHGKEPSTGDK